MNGIIASFVSVAMFSAPAKYLMWLLVPDLVGLRSLYGINSVGQTHLPRKTPRADRPSA